jgi:nucleotide-binding universal stress UspA family protein
MALFNKILFPIDLSETSRKIVPFVKEAIDGFGAELHIVYSLNLVPHYFNTDMSCIDEIEDGVRKEAEKKTRRFIESQFDDLSVQSKVLIGSPGQEIIIEFRILLRYAVLAEELVLTAPKGVCSVTILCRTQ